MSNKGIYIATSESDSGKSLITLGLMSMLLGKTAKVGYFRPIVEDSEEGLQLIAQKMMDAVVGVISAAKNDDANCQLALDMNVYRIKNTLAPIIAKQCYEAISVYC